MNKKLEQTFDLPSMEDALNDEQPTTEVEDQHKVNFPKDENDKKTIVHDSDKAGHYDREEVIQNDDDSEVNIKRALSVAEKIDKALPQVKDLESHDKDMDGYATDAMNSFRELMDLGMNSEARHAGKFFEVAQTMMKNAIEAKNAKADKKLRMIELQLKKQRVDQWDSKGSDSEEVIEGEGFVVGDRNKLLDQLIDKVSKNEEKPKEKDK
ncbi:MAG: hypothetical protein CBC05_03000 [Crocinitomicaceae bacterium TMED45]|nr:MAG: hypothetical protein CBC05_03000 [Crocinitomicaceae bacterium TMED45]|tara:strand:- start:24090 stop:24719 length:630 start_codon:yes stop_codon:yes gene_type:complete